jgi:hypothetical protein
MRIPANQQRLQELESEFRPLLIQCLKICSERRRWGLFEEGKTEEIAQILYWKEAMRLREMAAEIQKIRSEWGDTNKLAERFLVYCAERGENVPGESKRAARLLREIAEQEL